MKMIKNSLMILFLSTSLFFTSCSSDDDGGTSGSAAAGTIQAKVNGTMVTSVDIATFATQSGTFLQIQGNTGEISSKAFILNITTFNGVGTYDIGGGEFGLGQANATYTEVETNLSNPLASETKIWSAPHGDGGKTGEIKISELTDTNIIGTFNFTALNPEDDSIKTITEGSFNVEL